MTVGEPRRNESARAAGETYLFVLPWDLRADSGGVNHVVRSLYDGIAADGRLEPRVLVLSWDAAAAIEERDAAGRSIVRFRLMSFEQHLALLVGAARYLAQLPSELHRLRALVKRYRVAIVNCHYIGSSDLTWIIAKALGLFRGKVFLSLHGRDIRTLAELTGIRRGVWRWVLRHADAIIACSAGLAEETAAKFGLRPEQVVTIYNGFDIARLGPFLSAGDPPRHASGHGPSLLNIGTFEHKKGHDVLLRAFQRVLARRPTAHLTIIGRRAETADDTLRLVDELGLHASVTIRFDAPHEEALAALKAADLFVLPSRNEAFSVALLEAGAFGKPIVATDVCGVGELIENRVTGILVPAEDVAALASGILAALEDVQTASRYGRRLRERVMNHFTAEQTSRKYLRLAGLVPGDGLDGGASGTGPVPPPSTQPAE
jgi:glycosyltransferase involved in cell wall biosynthesis